jgi:hypothetical protein
VTLETGSLHYLAVVALDNSTEIGPSNEIEIDLTQESPTNFREGD